MKQSYRLLPDHAWIACEKTVRIAAGGTERLELTLRVPEDEAYFGKKWEDCILIQPDAGRAEFVRVRVETGLPKAVGTTEEGAP